MAVSCCQRQNFVEDAHKRAAAANEDSVGDGIEDEVVDHG